MVGVVSEHNFATGGLFTYSVQSHEPSRPTHDRNNKFLLKSKIRIDVFHHRLTYVKGPPDRYQPAGDGERGMETSNLALGSRCLRTWNVDTNVERGTLGSGERGAGSEMQLEKSSHKNCLLVRHAKENQAELVHRCGSAS
jgi:hypothetical protein